MTNTTNYRKPPPGRMTAERALREAADHNASAALCERAGRPEEAAAERANAARLTEYAKALEA